MPDKPEVPRLGTDAASIAGDYRRIIGHELGHPFEVPLPDYAYQALALTLRARLIQRWNETRQQKTQNGVRRTFYFSLEYLLGRILRNAALNMGIDDEVAEALDMVGLDLEEVVGREEDAGLGNGGLGRLAACYLDSCATLALPVTGYGLRYEYGLFRQRIRDGYQVEEPDGWLAEGYPWELARPEFRQIVRFGGRAEHRVSAAGQLRVEWVDTEDVLAMPYDVPIPGYRNGVVNTLRLWSARATQRFNLTAFNSGSFAEAVAHRHDAENITAVLYPNDDNQQGKELRLRQQYFLVAASLADCLRRWRASNGSDMSNFADTHRFQLNDTHPAVAVPELMRLLMDECGYDWDRAWEVTSSCVAYTNHTLLPEALETWPVPMFERLLPRILEIIYEINARFLSEVARRWPGGTGRLQRMSLIAEGDPQMVRMAHLAVVGSFSVNGVAELHSELVRTEVLKDFHDLWPERFNNKTNGVTQRRWLAACNPALAELISETIGEGWLTDLEHLSELAPHAEDPAFRERWAAVKRANKERAARLIADSTGVRIDTSVLLDVQVKRIHEYKRQLMNVLHAIHLYRRVRAGEEITPRTILIGGKAAPGYHVAKQIIKLANNVAAVVNRDPATIGVLRVVFLPNYSVSRMEIICPAADLSEQISTAGKEASGTGNMKFMLNGAVTVGTLDGANLEILEAVGEENFFLFGLAADEVAAARADYDPASIVAADPDLEGVIALLRSGHFNQFEPGIFDGLIASVLAPGDPWMTAAGFGPLAEAQARAGEAYAHPERWVRMSIANTAASGPFSSDRSVRQYNEDIWGLEPLTVAAQG